MIVDLPQAQAIFDGLPVHLRWPTMSPAYVAADAMREASSRPLFLVDRDGDGLLMHSVLESPVPDSPARDWQSAYGYGGPIAAGLDEAALARAWARLDEEAARRRVVAEFVRFHPGLDNQAWYPGAVRDDRAVVLVDLRVPDLLASYSTRARTAVKKALREGLEARWETTATARAAFPAFYRRSMLEIGASSFYHFDDAYFDALMSLAGARTLSIMRGDERLSMAIFLFGPVQVEYHLSGTSAAGRRAAATNLLIHAAAEAAREGAMHRLYLGGGTTAAADDTLLRFKSSFAPANNTFRIGHRIHDAATYQSLREIHPSRAGSARVLFYRS